MGMVKGLRVARVSGMSMTQSSAPLSRNASPPFTCSIGVNGATIVMLASSYSQYKPIKIEAELAQMQLPMEY